MNTEQPNNATIESQPFREGFVTSSKLAVDGVGSGVRRCPDCLDGPLPGAQWDYGHTSWKWRECETCGGTGRVANGAKQLDSTRQAATENKKVSDSPLASTDTKTANAPLG